MLKTGKFVAGVKVITPSHTHFSRQRSFYFSPPSCNLDFHRSDMGGSWCTCGRFLRGAIVKYSAGGHKSCNECASRLGLTPNQVVVPPRPGQKWTPRPGRKSSWGGLNKARRENRDPRRRAEPDAPYPYPKRGSTTAVEVPTPAFAHWDPQQPSAPICHCAGVSGATRDATHREGIGRGPRNRC